MTTMQTCGGLALAVAGLVLASCATTPQPAKSLTGQHVLRGPSGRTYALKPSNETETYETTAEAIAAAPSCTKWGASGADVFDGCARRAPKTTMLSTDSIAAASFNDVTGLKATLQDDDSMIQHHPLISHAADSQRTDEELRIVTVDGYLYAVTKESDRDFHLIIGDKDCTQHTCFMNIEVSALPVAGDQIPDFTATRQSLVDMFGEEPQSTYWQVDPPAPVHVEGSLFYDVDHRPGQVGPTWAKPDTSWEIHPVRTLALRDE